MHTYTYGSLLGKGSNKAKLNNFFPQDTDSVALLNDKEHALFSLFLHILSDAI